MREFFTPGIRIVWFVLLALCLMYALMVYMVGSGTFSFVIWLAGAAFFGACFYLAGRGRWAALPAGIRYAVTAAVGIGLVIFMICQMAIFSHFSDRGRDGLDYIIVLGAQMKPNGPSVIYSYRLKKAAEYMKDNPDTICITTGGQGSNELQSEGAGGAAYLESLGVQASRIEVEEKSMDTLQNIRNALDMIEAKEGSTEDLGIGIVTNGFHVFRGVSIARKLSDADICGIAAYMQPQYIPNNLVRETFGIIRDFCAGRL